MRTEPLRVLLIEPDRYARETLRFLVEAAYTGVVTTTARSAADAMEMLHQTQYHIVICDDAPVADTLKQLCDEAKCSFVLMTRDSRLKPSDLQPLHPGLPAQSLLYKPIMFRDFCRKLHRAVLIAMSRQAGTSRRRSGMVRPPRCN